MRGRRPGAPQLAFNFVPVSFSADSYDGGLVDFESPEQLNALRTDLDGTHVVSRTRGGIACVPLVPDAETCGEPTTFVTREYRRLTMRLVQPALLRSVLEWGYTLRKPGKASFVSRLPGKDLLVAATGDRQVQALRSLHVYPQYVLDSRVVGPSGHPGVIIGVKSRYEIDLTVEELIVRGVDVRGLYVVADDGMIEPFAHMDPYATRRNVGAIDHVDSLDLVLHDAPGAARISAGQAWVESRRETFDTVIATLAGADATQIVKELEQATFELLGAFGRFEKTVEIASRLSRRGPLEIAHGLSVTLEPPVGSSSNARTVGWSRYDAPTFKFDQAGDKTHRATRSTRQLHALFGLGRGDLHRLPALPRLGEDPPCCHLPSVSSHPGLLAWQRVMPVLQHHRRRIRLRHPHRSATLARRRLHYPAGPLRSRLRGQPQPGTPPPPCLPHPRDPARSASRLPTPGHREPGCDVSRSCPPLGPHRPRRAARADRAGPAADQRV